MMDIIPILGRGFDSNVYLVTGKTPTVIDTGTGMYHKYVVGQIKSNVDISDIEQIIFTHEHIDHTGGANDLIKLIGKDVITVAHTKAAYYLENGIEPSSAYFGMTSPKIGIDRKVSGGEVLTIGDEEFEVIHTPGHTEGSICLYCKNKRILFSGDTIFSNGGIGRYDLPDGDPRSLMRSIEFLSKLKVTDLYPGHGVFIRGEGDLHVALALRSAKLFIEG